MKQLKCEMCGSVDMLKQDGVFVCQSCGTKYSVEEAKKMMVEGTVEVVGTVKVDESDKQENYYTMAENAYIANNKQEAENYCNKIIERDATHYKAWLLKGKSAGWSSTLAKQRLSESVVAFARAIQHAPADEKEAITKEAKEEVKKIAVALIALRGDRFEKWPDEEEKEGFSSDISNIRYAMLQFISQAGVLIPRNEMMNPIATKINQAVVAAWKNKVLPDFNKDEHPSEHMWKTFKQRCLNCIELVKLSIDLSDGDDLDDIVRYQNLIVFEEKLIASCSYGSRYINGTKTWYKEWSLTDEAKEARRKNIKNHKDKIMEIKKKNIAKQDEGKEVASILALASANLKNKDMESALIRYESVINKMPNEKVGYLGKALAMYDFDDLNSMRSPLKTAMSKQASAEYAGEVKKILGCGVGQYSENLLMIAANMYWPAEVEMLVEQGADINAKSGVNTTALWYVCFRKPGENADEARRIARILLDKGAQIDVTNKGGVSLLNADTDPEIVRMIKAKHPNAQKGTKAASSGGCYVATAVYGSYDCPQVWTLRRFRDYTLAESWYGRAFIRTYYAISPTLVKWFGQTAWFKRMWKGTLDRMVNRLNANGVQDTPYQDKNW